MYKLSRYFYMVVALVGCYINIVLSFCFSFFQFEMTQDPELPEHFLVEQYQVGLLCILDMSK